MKVITIGPGRLIPESIPAGDYVLVPVDKDRCLPKVRDDEPIFVLRGQDMSAPAVIIFWAHYNSNVTGPSKKTEAAQGDAMDILAWQQANPDKVKWPD